MIKVFVIDDSLLVRKVLKKIIDSSSHLEFLGEAPNPIDAFEVFKRTGLPDLFVLDINMPKMDGLTFLKQIQQQRPTPTVICSSIAAKGSANAIEALRLGAADIIPKPNADPNRLDWEDAEYIEATLVAAYRAKIQRRPSTPSPRPKISTTRTASEKIVLIGASTGGVQILERIFLQLRPHHAPIAVVQHIPAGFSRSLAQRLDQICVNSKVVEAQEGESLERGKIAIAPGGIHMELVKSGFSYALSLKDYPRVNYHKPSVDILFKSGAKLLGAKAVGFLLTGMGDDGARGLLELKKSGAQTFAQDEESSIVYGMPMQAMKMGAADRALNTDEIASVINGF